MNIKRLFPAIIAIAFLPLQGCIFTSALLGVVNAPKAVADTIVGVTQVRRREYLEYEKYIDELNIARETQGLQPVQKLPYNDWKNGKKVSPSGVQTPVSPGESTQVSAGAN